MVWQDSLKTMSTLQDRVSLLFLLKIFTLKSEREKFGYRRKSDI